MSGPVDVVVVGGGIGGAALALALARGGRTAVVLEKSAAPTRAGRPEILWPATTAAFDALGVGERMRRDALVPIAAIEVRGAGDADARPARLRLGDGATRHASDPTATRGVLLAAAEATGRVEVRRGVDVREVRIGADGVEVAGVRAAVVVGDDGARSRVRAAMGVDLATELFPAEFAGTDVAAPELPRDVVRGWISGLGAPRPSGGDDGLDPFGVLSVPLPHGRAAVVLLLAPNTWDGLVARGAEALAERIARIAPPLGPVVRRPAFPADFVHVLRPFGHAARYVGDRAALIGDAVHPMSPAGGQGANAAVADAVALADVLLRRLPSGDVSAAALAPYEAARRPANERSVTISRRAARALRVLPSIPRAGDLAAAAMAVVRHAPALRRRIVETFAEAFVGAEERSDVGRARSATEGSGAGR